MRRLNLHHSRRAFALLVGLVVTLCGRGQTVVQTVGDIDGFGYGTAPGASVPENVYDNRGGADPTFTDHTIPDTGGSTTLSFTISFGQTFATIQTATFTMGLQEVEFLGNHISLDGMEIAAPLSAYVINGSPLTGTTATNFFDTVVSQGDFHTDLVTLALPSAFYSLLTDGEAVLSIVGMGESYAIDYAQLQITPVPEPASCVLLAGLAALGAAARRCSRRTR